MSLGDYLPEIQSGTIAVNDMMAAVKKAQEDGVIDLGEKIQLLFMVILHGLAIAAQHDARK